MNQIGIRELLRKLKDGKVAGYGASRIPNELDTEIEQVVVAYLRFSEVDREAIKASVEREHKFVLLAFSERMASLAVRRRSKSLLILALASMFLQIGYGDVREDITILTLVHAAAIKIGLEPRDVFMEAARQFGLGELKGLERFLKRADEDKDISSMGYVEKNDFDGFRFVREW